MQLQWHGHYLDGRSANRQPVVVYLEQAGLTFATEGGAKTFWPYEEIRQTQGLYAGEQVRLERGSDPAEALLIPDQAFLTTLHRLAPAGAGRFHDPARRKLRVLLTAFAAVAAVAIGAALYLWAIPGLAALAAARVPVSWEEQLGESVVRQFAPEKQRCAEPSRSRRIEQIMQALAATLPKPSYTFRVIVVENPMLNAFAAPGGYIVIFTGLLDRTRTAEELAGVLAHEAQHILERHSTRMVLEHASTGILLAALTGDLSGSATYGIEAARVMGALRYSRAHEEEADSGGLKMLLAAGLDPSGMVSFFETMKQAAGDNPKVLSYLSTHPSTENRIERLKSLIEQAPRARSRLFKDYDWTDIRRICPARKPQ